MCCQYNKVNISSRFPTQIIDIPVLFIGVCKIKRKYFP